MARRAEEAENHWPGFVDALSTIVMVVTFLLIILGIVIFVISKNISTELAKSASEVEAAQSALAQAQDKAAKANEQIRAAALAQAKAELRAEMMHQKKPAAKQSDTEGEKRDIKMAQVERQVGASQKSDAQQKAGVEKRKQADAKEAKQNKQQQNRKSAARSKKSAASFRPQFSEQLTQNDEIDSKDRLSVRSRQTRNTKQIVIATVEQERKHRKVHVTSSTAILSLLFRGGIKITKEASGELQDFLKETAGPSSSAKYEIRAFINTDKGSISEARRLAYYRALATRNELLKLGVKARRIAIRVGSSGRPGDAGKVNVYLK